MDILPPDQQTLRYVTNRGWWTPTLLLVLLLLAQSHSGQLSRWWPFDMVALFLLVLILHVLTHPTLKVSAEMISQRRGPFRVSVDLGSLRSVRVDTRARQLNAIDPQTGQPRQVNFYFKQSDDWSGKRPAQGVIVTDNEGHRLALRFLRTDVHRWGGYLLDAVKVQPEVELGPRVIETLERVVR